MGKSFGRYRVVSQIGAGGMGVVYRAVDLTLGRELALKFLSPGTAQDPRARARLIREARLASSLNHPHICTVYDIGEFEGQVYIAFELIAGNTLSDAIPSCGLPQQTVLQYGAQIADAIAHAHAHNILHRDLKSSNVVITPERQIKVLDFGLAQHGALPDAYQNSEGSTQSTLWAGTLQYSAPETLRGEGATAASDIWSLGIVLYEMCSGRLPFSAGKAADTISSILRDSPPRLPAGISRALSLVIERCLQKEATARFSSVAEVRAALESITATESWGGETITPSRRHFNLRLGWLTAAILVLAMLAQVTVWLWTSRSDRIPGRIESMAVLPLENVSGDRAQDYLVEGMTDILITDLAKMKALKRVISRNSVVPYASTTKSLKQVAQELNVDALVTGTVAKFGDRIRITAQLIDPRSDRHMWADEYEGDIRDVIAFEGAAALHIAQQIKIAVSPQEQQIISSTSNANAAVRERYLKGRFYWNKRDLESIRKSLAYFEEAVHIDPNYAPAYAGLADYYVVLANFGIYEFAKAEEAAKRALQLDDNLAEAHASLGMITFYKQKHWKDAEREFQTASNLNPNYATTYQYYAIFLAYAGRIEESVAAAQRARELDPLSLVINSYVGHVLYLSRRYDEAERQLQKTLELDPDFAAAHYFLSFVLVQQRSFDEAIAHARMAQKLWPGDVDMTAVLGYAYAAAGKAKEAREVLAPIRNDARYTADLAFADIALHDSNRALTHLEAGQEQAELWWLSLPSEPALDPIREDKRFLNLLQRASLLSK